MKKFLQVAVVAAVAAMAPMQAHANPMVAVGWLWAAGAGGLVAGWLTAPLWRPIFVQPAVAAPIVQDPYVNCRHIQAKVQGRWRNVIVCD